MALILLAVLIITELGLAFFEAAGKRTKKEWNTGRLTVCAAETAIFLLMLLLPGIDLSFRFAGLAAILVIRLILAGIFFLASRRSDKAKSTAAVAASAFFGIAVLSASMIPAFLIRDYSGRPTTGEYRTAQVSAILTDPDRLETFETDGSHREVPVHFYYPENIGSFAENSLPLVIFSHGAFGYYQSNTSAYNELASHGYVVVSLDHPYHSFFTKDTSGRTITVDPDFFRTALTVGGTENEADVYDITSGWMELRIGDMNFVTDELEAASERKGTDEHWYYDSGDEAEIVSVLKATDHSRIGLMGHSLGGATAVTVGRRADISAVADLDGTMIGEETGVTDNAVQVNDEAYETPLLVIDNEEHHKGRLEAKQNGTVYSNNVILENAVCGHETYFKGSGHMNFTDLPLISPALAGALGTGSIDAEECVDKMNALILDFFDCYLKGAGEFSTEESY